MELLLTLEARRRDCKQPAKEAIKRFETLRGVLEAPAEDLQRVHGIVLIVPSVSGWCRS